MIQISDNGKITKYFETKFLFFSLRTAFHRVKFCFVCFAPVKFVPNTPRDWIREKVKCNEISR